MLEANIFLFKIFDTAGFGLKIPQKEGVGLCKWQKFGFARLEPVFCCVPSTLPIEFGNLYV